MSHCLWLKKKQAAGVLKKAEGILTIVVSNPKGANPAEAKKEEKPSTFFRFSLFLLFVLF